MSEVIISQLKKIGLSEQKANETVKNKQLVNFICEIIKSAEDILSSDDSAKTINPVIGSLLYQVGTRLKQQCREHMPLIIKHICNGNIYQESQVSAALEFLLHRTVSGFTEQEFMDACGIGVVVTPDQIESAVEQSVNRYRSELISQRYRFNTGRILGEVRQQLRWADGRVIKNEVDLQILTLLGPKTKADLDVNIGKGKSAKNKDKSVAKDGGGPAKSEVVVSMSPEVLTMNGTVDNSRALAPVETITDIMKKLILHLPGENFKSEGYVATPKTMSILKDHVARTGGSVMTRFPPEPNGVLHIGHAKAININFGYAKTHSGECYLRYDDTNPEKEEEKFFTAILDMVTWLGYKPYKITHSSDYFDQLYEWAKVLIRNGGAYVCHQRSEELKGFNAPLSPWRDRAIQESLQLFEDMRRGKFDEGEATLRLKVTLEEGKVDPVAYRIKFVPHYRVGNKWCIYPTYDYTHCLCDSIEDITHSLCTKEFQSRRSSYYWLCNALSIYCPVQWEYGRLNMNYTVVSKRKIAKLISEKIVRDWDDPRLFTLTALRRRGFPADAINQFVAKMGISVAQSVVDPMMLEACVRDVLNVSAPRVMAVLDPLLIEIVNFPNSPNDDTLVISVPDFPAEPERGQHSVPFTSKIFIDRSDFKETAEKSFKRLTLLQPVGLKHAGYVLTICDIVRDANNNECVGLRATCEPVSDGNKPKGFIQWVANPVACEVRLYDRLFYHASPEDAVEVPNGYLSDVNQKSLTVISSALVDRSVLSPAAPSVYTKYQFERIGFFSVDPDTTPDRLVFNRTVLLKEDSGKK